MSNEARDNLHTGIREIWRDGRVVEVFTKAQIDAMRAENERLRATYNVPPFGTLRPYRPKGTNK